MRRIALTCRSPSRLGFYHLIQLSAATRPDWVAEIRKQRRFGLITLAAHFFLIVPDSLESLLLHVKYTTQYVVVTYGFVKYTIA